MSLILIEQEQMAPNSLLQFTVKYSLQLKWKKKQCVKNVIDETELIVSFYLDKFLMFKHVYSHVSRVLLNSSGMILLIKLW